VQRSNIFAVQRDSAAKFCESGAQKFALLKRPEGPTFNSHDREVVETTVQRSGEGPKGPTVVLL